MRVRLLITSIACFGCGLWLVGFFFFFQAEDGIRDSVASRGLGDVYKRQVRLLITFITCFGCGLWLVGFDAVVGHCV